MPYLKSYLGQENSGIKAKNQIIEEYKTRFHDAPSDSVAKQVDRKARTRMRFLNK
jgi:GTP1/Obg family GTP-binding protein